MRYKGDVFVRFSVQWMHYVVVILLFSLAHDLNQTQKWKRNISICFWFWCYLHLFNITRSGISLPISYSTMWIITVGLNPSCISYWVKDMKFQKKKSLKGMYLKIGHNLNYQPVLWILQNTWLHVILSGVLENIFFFVKSDVTRMQPGEKKTPEILEAMWKRRKRWITILFLFFQGATFPVMLCLRRDNSNSLLSFPFPKDLLPVSPCLHSSLASLS